MREKFTGAIEIADAVDVAEDLARQDRPFEAERYLLTRLVRHPLSAGVAEALLAMGRIFRTLSQWHHMEVCSLVGYRLRATALETSTTPRLLSTLALACARQRSLDEAQRYSQVAAALGMDDPVMQEMIEEAAALTDAGLAEVADPPRDTPLPDCSDLLARATALASVDPKQVPLALHKLSTDLSRRPPALGLFRPWRMVAEVHVGTTPTDPNKGFQVLYQTAMATAAAGKAILVNPEAAARDDDLWFWYGSGLAQLSFYPEAVQVLEQTYRVATSDRTRQALDYARAMANQPEDSPYLPDSHATWQAMREDAMARRPSSAMTMPPEEPPRPGMPWWSIPLSFIIGGGLGYTWINMVAEPYNALLGAGVGGVVLVPLFCKLSTKLELWKRRE